MKSPHEISINPMKIGAYFITHHYYYLIMETKFTVPEISCGHCKETIESTINSLENVELSMLILIKNQ